MNNRNKFLRLLLLVLLCIGGMTLNAQTINKEFKAESLKNVLKEVEQQTGLSIIYQTGEVNENKLISENFKNATIENVLSKILDKDLTYQLQNKMIVISKANVKEQKSSGKPKSVKGVVTDDKGEPIIGASILVKGTANGTITDIDGNFTIDNVLPEDLLAITYVGYLGQELKVKDKNSFSITLLEDSKQLDEVVVVGYGTVKKRDLTGSVTSINSAKVNAVPVTSAASALQGRASGVVVSNSSWEPGDTPSILIRGKRSINASNDPLFVIDGIPVTGGMGEISPADIESMEVLKDASATAIYGSRGANGVIIITTKQGKEGKTHVDYNGYVGVQTIQNKLDLMNGAEYAEFTREAYRNSAKNKYNSDIPSKEEDMLLPMFKQDAYVLESVLMGYDENGNYDPSRVRSHNWFDEVTRNGIITDHQLNIRGGGSKTNFMASVTYNKTDGIMKDKSYERYSIRLNLNHTINKYVKIGAQTQYSHSTQQRGSDMEKDNYVYRVTPLGRLFNDDGTVPTNVGSDALMYNPMMNMVDGAVDRPLKTSRFLGSYYLEVKFPVDGLTFRSNFGVDSRTVQDYEYLASETTERQLKASYAKNAVSKYSMFTWENYFSYNKEFGGGKHSIGATLLQSIQQDLKESNNASMQDMSSGILKYYDLAAGLTVDGVKSNYIKWNMASFMGRINYGFLGKYLLTVSARYDGSSRLADGHKWVLFPSAALAWRMSDERFLKNVSWLDNLKLRLGYGKTGNSSVDPYQTKGSLGLKYYVYNNGATEVIGYAPKLMANDLLTWETTDQWNVGIDFGFLKNRINGSIDFYLQNTHDLLLERQLPVVSGFSSVMSNVGSTRNKGIEISLNTQNIITKNFTWNTDWMFSANKEEIVELYNGKVDDIGSEWFIGQPIDVYYNYEKTGIWQNTPEDLAEMQKFNDKGGNFTVGSIKVKDQDGDYKITDKDKVILGNKRPKFIASMVNNFEYRGFDLSVFLYASVGGMLKNNIEYEEKPGRANGMKLDYWTPSNPTNAFPRPNADVETLDYIKTLGYDKADFLRVRNITLGYTLPEHISKKISAQKIRFYFSANNPLIFTNFTGIDPEGADGRTSPSYSTWMFGINLSL